MDWIINNLKSMYKENNNQIKDWWSKKRALYNAGIFISGIISFILYCFVGYVFIYPIDEEFEITLFTIFFQGIGYAFFIIIANLFYNLGYILDISLNENNSESYRNKLFKIGFITTIAFPFSIPILLFIEYLFH
jgi:uncharacterized membrane protein